jgi:putative membrane protein
MEDGKMRSNRMGWMASMLALLMATAGVAEAQMSGGTAAALTDPEIAHVAVTANAIDVEVGKLALKESKNAQVRGFAQTMITDHTAVIGQASALVKKLGVTPVDNAVSQSLWTGAKEAEAGLAKVKGAAFDRAYMDREVGFHAAVLQALDATLIPGSQNAELKNLLVTVRPAIVAHLAHAKEIRAALGGGK